MCRNSNKTQKSDCNDPYVCFEIREDSILRDRLTTPTETLNNCVVL